ncbi:MAG: hypothetical protein LBP77_03290 [Rickettsiales bacterium]|nr:hypothetical protein [Rickettsiales bacterium]
MSLGNRICLLDCTLRDGGQGLEIAAKKGYDRTFSQTERTKIAELLEKSNIEYIEIGAIKNSIDDLYKYSIYKSIEDVSNFLPQKTVKSSKYAAMFVGPDTPYEDLPEYKEGMCEYIRVMLRYSEFKKSLDFCKVLNEKGYKVFVQPTVTARYTNDDLNLVLDAANDINAHAVYFVDSYGFFNSDDIKQYFELFDKKLNKGIKIGFHAHNNLSLALPNAIGLLNIESERKIIIDSCLLGMGQGAGNLQTELISIYLNENYGKEYDYCAILDACELIDKFSDERFWGNSLKTIIPAVCKVAYQNSYELRDNLKFSYSDIYRILNNIPDEILEIKYRYTQNALKKLIEHFEAK